MDRYQVSPAKHVGVFLILFLVAPALGAPYRPQNSDPDSSTSTLEVLRNVQRILGITRPLGTKVKLVKQDTGADSEGAANALAYLTDSFGGQLAGQILSVILSSVTGDVRGILGNSLSLFPGDERRDRVQFFLDEISNNFLKITGLGVLTQTTKSPLQQSTGVPLIGGGGQINRLSPAQAYPITSLGGVGPIATLGGSNVGGVGPIATLGGSNIGGVGGVGGGGTFGNGVLTTIGSNLGGSRIAQLQQQLQQQQKPQQGTAAQQPIIYVLPSLPQHQAAAAAAAASNVAPSATQSQGASATAAAKPASGGVKEDDSEEDLSRKLYSRNVHLD